MTNSPSLNTLFTAGKSSPAQPFIHLLKAAQKTPSKADTTNDSFTIPKNWQIEEEYATHYFQWKNTQKKEHLDSLLKAVEPEIHNGIRYHLGNQAQTNPTIQAQAKAITVRAIETYNPEEGKLKTHIINNLQGLKRQQRETYQVLRIPEKAAQEYTIINQKQIELREKLGREPSTAELADATGISTKRIEYLNKFHSGIATSQTEMILDEESGPTPPAVHTTHDQEIIEMIYYDYEDDPISQKIMEWSFGLFNNPVLSNQEIAKRLNITPSAVTQRKKKIQERIDQARAANIF